MLWGCLKGADKDILWISKSMNQSCKNLKAGQSLESDEHEKSPEAKKAKLSHESVPPS